MMRPGQYKSQRPLKIFPIFHFFSLPFLFFVYPESLAAVTHHHTNPMSYIFSDKYTVHPIRGSFRIRKYEHGSRPSLGHSSFYRLYILKKNLSRYFSSTSD